jgi:hypothetical protein
MKLPRFASYPYHYIAAGFAALGLLYALFAAVDAKGLKPKYAVTHVVSRHYRPLSHGTITTKSGNTFHTRQTTIPEAWQVAVTLDGATGWSDVTHGDYDEMKEGAEVEVVYSRHRVRNALTISTIRLMKPVD